MDQSTSVSEKKNSHAFSFAVPSHKSLGKNIPHSLIGNSKEDSSILHKLNSPHNNTLQNDGTYKSFLSTYSNPNSLTVSENKKNGGEKKTKRALSPFSPDFTVIQPNPLNP